ncbi:MAG TPA: nucleoside triphosphate pyrophosphatase [Nitrospirales bacterium]|nr:septum formation protein Maf [Nitrospiraceae bacterium]HNP31036.1 nucleoside triphosphate pyrophosphatase [Nitrospirales bacterium]
MQLTLASTSPRRRELLELLGLPFRIVSPLSEEKLSLNLSPIQQTRQFALEKAQSVATQHPHDLVIGSDTVIEIEGRLLGKPESMQEAESMLRHLRGQCHQVHTGVAVIHQVVNFVIDFVETAFVWIKPFDEATLTAYLSTEESLGKAGSYSIQGEGARLIDKIEGDYPTIVGLPLWRTAHILEQQGLVLPNPVEEIYRVKPYANWRNF